MRGATIFEEKEELKQIWTEVPLFTSLMPYRQAELADMDVLYLWWILCTLFLHAR